MVANIQASSNFRFLWVSSFSRECKSSPPIKRPISSCSCLTIRQAMSSGKIFQWNFKNTPLFLTQITPPNVYFDGKNLLCINFFNFVQDYFFRLFSGLHLFSLPFWNMCCYDEKVSSLLRVLIAISKKTFQIMFPHKINLWIHVLSRWCVLRCYLQYFVFCFHLRGSILQKQ